MNVIFIITDTMRIDDLGCYGNEIIKTPCLDRLASESVRFTRYYTEGLPTVPARRAYHTGRYTLLYKGWEALAPDEIILPEILWEQGHLTALSTDVYHLFRQGMGFGRGFGHVNAVRGREDDPWIDAGNVSDAVERHWIEPLDGEVLSKWYTKESLAQYLRNRSTCDAVGGWKSEDDHFSARTVQGAIDWLEKCRRAGHQDKLYLCVDIFAPHTPIDPPSPYDQMYTDPDTTCKDVLVPRVGPLEGFCSEEQLDHILRRRYGFVTFVDRWVGHLIDWLRDHGMLDDTLLVYVSDHGDFFGEHGLLMKCRPWPYDILSHAPLMIRHPEHATGAVADTFAQSCDLMPTMMGALGLATPEHVQGTSLMPAVRDPKAPVRDFAIAGHHRASESIRDADWSYYRWHSDASGKSGPELFSLRDDPGETRNLIGENQEVATELDGQLTEFLQSLV